MGAIKESFRLRFDHEFIDEDGQHHKMDEPITAEYDYIILKPLEDHPVIMQDYILKRLTEKIEMMIDLRETGKG